MHSPTSRACTASAARAGRGRVLAELEYAAFIGAQQLGLFDSPARAARLSRELARALARP